MNAPQALPEADLARADVYALLARLLFAAPDRTLLDTLTHSHREGAGELSVAWNSLCTAAAASASEVAAEYETLFISIGKPEVSLYASWHLTGFLMEKPLALLRDDLTALGLARPEGRHDPEDHIAGELEVMRHLVMAAATDSQKRFFVRHLQPWYSQLCAALETVPAAVFYRRVAVLLREFLDVERDYFALQADSNGGVK